MQISIFTLRWMIVEFCYCCDFYAHLQNLDRGFDVKYMLMFFVVHAGLAFHPLDGILQACPHVIALFLMPMHFFTHEILLFCEGIWTTNIHDCIDGNVWGIMGAGFHTIHHTTYRHNYGHYTVFMDWLFGTLRDPYERKAEAVHVKDS